MYMHMYMYAKFVSKILQPSKNYITKKINQNGVKLYAEPLQDGVSDLMSAGEAVDYQRALDAEWQRGGRVGPRPFVLPIIFFLDKTRLSATGSHQARPFCLQLGNRSGPGRRSKDGVSTLGNIAIPERGDMTQTAYDRERRTFNAAQLDFLLEDLPRLQEHGIQLPDPTGMFVSGICSFDSKKKHHLFKFEIQ